MADLLESLLTEAHRIEEDAEHSAERHFETARLWSLVRWGVGIPTTGIAALVATKGLTFQSPDTLVYLSSFVAVGSALLTLLKPTDRVADHMRAGNSYLALRNQTRLFREIDCNDQKIESQRADRLRKLAAKRDELNASSPPTPRVAFLLGRTRIREGETSYKIDHP